MNLTLDDEQTIFLMKQLLKEFGLGIKQIMNKRVSDAKEAEEAAKEAAKEA